MSRKPAGRGYINSENLKKGSDFPWLVLGVAGVTPVPRNPGFRVMHWHDDLQFIYVMEGAVRARTLEDETEVRAGDGVFINRGVVHMVEPREGCRYRSFIFPEKFLCGYAGSAMEELTRSVTSCGAVTLLHLDRSESRHGRALDLLAELASLEDREQDRLYPGEVMARLHPLWLEILRNVPIARARAAGPVERRMRLLLRHIEEHYGGEITLGGLVAAAGISRSEALRCFRAALGTTPFGYITEYRLMQAARLLARSSLPIGEVAERCGFSQQSYFGRRFREHTGMSPGSYRKLKRAGGPQSA